MKNIPTVLAGLLGFTAALLAPLPTQPSAAAQQAPAAAYHAPLPIPQDMQPRGKRHLEISRTLPAMVSGATAFDERVVGAWLKEFVFRAMTDPAYYHDIADMRTTLVRGMNNARSQEVHDYLVSESFTLAKVLCDRNFPPPTRINAMLLIADLNQQERSLTGGPAVAIPYAPALPYMREQLNKAEQSDAVRLAALAGILRHVETQWFLPRPQIAEADLRAINTEMIALANQGEPAAGRSAEGHAWLRSRAVDVLGALIALVPDRAAFDALVNVTDDVDQPLWLRVRAAHALGRVNYANLPDAQTINQPEVAAKLAGVLADACKLEVTRIEQQRKKRNETQGFGGAMAGGMAMPAMPMMGGAGAGLPPPGMAGAGGAGAMVMPQMGGGIGGMPGLGGGGANLGGIPPHYVDTSRRRLLYNLACIRTAVSGPSKDADVKGLQALTTNNAAAAKTVGQIDTAVKKLVAAVDVKSDKLVLDDMLKEIRLQMQDMERIRPARPVSTPEADAPDADIPSDADVPAAAPAQPAAAPQQPAAAPQPQPAAAAPAAATAPAAAPQ